MKYDCYPHRSSMTLGIVQNIAGILCLIFAAVDVGFIHNARNGLTDLANPYDVFVFGTLFIITGGLGIGAGKQKTRCKIITFMVMCIISASLALCLLIGGIFRASTIIYVYKSRCEYQNHDTDFLLPHLSCGRMGYKVVVAMEMCLAVFSLIEAVAAIWGSAICCKAGMCCCTKQIIMYQSLPQGDQYAYLPEGMMSYIPQDAILPPYSGSVQPPASITTDVQVADQSFLESLAKQPPDQ